MTKIVHKHLKPCFLFLDRLPDNPPDLPPQLLREEARLIHQILNPCVLIRQHERIAVVSVKLPRCVK